MSAPALPRPASGGTKGAAGTNGPAGTNGTAGTLEVDLDEAAAGPATDPRRGRPVVLALVLVAALLVGGAARSALDPRPPAVVGTVAVEATADLVSITMAGTPSARVRVQVSDVGDVPVRLVRIDSAHPTLTDPIDAVVRIEPGQTHDHELLAPVRCLSSTSGEVSTLDLTVTVRQVRDAGLLGPEVTVPVVRTGRLARPSGVCTAAARALPPSAFDAAGVLSQNRNGLTMRLVLGRMPQGADRVVTVTAGDWVLRTPASPVAADGTATLLLDGAAQRCEDLVATDTLPTGLTVGAGVPGTRGLQFRYAQVGPDLAAWLLAVHDRACGARASLVS